MQSQLDDKRGLKKNYWKKYSKDYYIKHNEILKRTRHSKYAENPSPVKKRMRLNYSKNQSPVRNRMRLSYSEKEFRYNNNVQNDDKLLEEKLMGNHSELGIDPPIKLPDDLRKPNEIAKANLTNYITTEQYKEPLTKKLSTEKKIPLNNARIEAENMLKWAVASRKEHVHSLRSKLHRIRSKIEVILTKSNLMQDSKEKYEVLTGSSLHSCTSEPFFSEPTYTKFNDNSFPLQVHTDGKCYNLFPPAVEGCKADKKWKCNPKISNINDNGKLFCRLNDIMKNICSNTLFSSLKFISLMETHNMINTHSKKMGYPLMSDIENLTITDMQFLRSLSPHYPFLRAILKLLYGINNSKKHINEIEDAIRNLDIKSLIICGDEYKKSGASFLVHGEEYENEDEILFKYKTGLQVMKRKVSDTPTKVCMSCQKLHFQRDVQNINKLRVPLEGDLWKRLTAHINNFNLPNEFICCYCLKYFRSLKMPPTCLINNLFVQPVPNEIAILNNYEKLLIQRAKAFQVVTKMGTVSGNNKPSRFSNRQVIGRTFHLPLPLEETLARLPNPEQCIIPQQDLYVIVRSIPTKQRNIWESLVNITNVYNALMWLKKNNTLYQSIDLPNCAEKLFNELDNVNAQFEANSEIKCDEFLQKSHSHKENSIELSRKENALFEDQALKDCKDPKVSNNKYSRAMLTQKNFDDQYYHHLTINSINEEKINKPAKELYQLLKVDADCIDNRDLELDVKCFPDLYPTGRYGMNEKRFTKLSVHEYSKLRVLSYDSRFRLNLQYLFFLLNLTNIRQLAAGIYQKMNTASVKLTAREYLLMLNGKEIDGSLKSIFARLRNSPSFWYKPRAEINTMIMAYGPATFFLTLSPGEYNWKDLDAYLKEVNVEKCKGKSTSALIAMDPVSTSRFIDNKFKAVMEFISSKDGPLGEVIHYVWRREYQSRGMQHFHILLWVKNAPVIGISSNDEIAEFTSKYVTCSLPDVKLFPTLHNRVTHFQTHHHNSYCMRLKKTKKGKVRICRFGFPRTETKTLTIRTVAASIYGRRNLRPNSRLYDLPRTKDERYINDYNAPIMLAWEGNMDLQVICEKSTILSHYITKYQTKAEKSFNVDVFSDINSNKSLQLRLWNIAMRSLNSRECGALEAADTLLGIPLYGKDRNTIIKYVNVYKNRQRKVKNYKQMQELDENSTAIFESSLVDDHYPARPQELENVCLYDFVKCYDIVKEIKDTTVAYKFKYGFIKKRKIDCLISHKIYNVQQNPEDYFYSPLLLFKPWRSLDNIKGTYETYSEAFDDCKNDLILAFQHHEKLQEIHTARDEVITLVNDLVQNNKSTPTEVKQNKTDEFSIIEAAGAMNEFRNALPNKIEDLHILINKLNEDQKRVFHYVTKYLHNDKNEILRHFVSGVGGTGKSFVIKILKLWVMQTLQKEVAVCAPTGIAAFNIDGLTIHRLLQLPIEHGGIDSYKNLNDDVLQILRTNLKDVVLIIIDEISMVSNVTLMYIHLRLSEIFNTVCEDDGWFGKIHILLFGDLLQLPPVMQNAPFMELNQSEIDKYFSCLHATNIWKDLFSYDELTINMRQKDDHTFQALLSRIRLGIINQNDVEILCRKQIDFKSDSSQDKLLELCNYIQHLSNDTICLLPTRSQCEDINRKMLELIPGKIIVLIAKDDIDCEKYLKQRALKKLNTYEEDNSRTAGLDKKIEVKIGTKIMLRRNVDVTLGLVNGAIGTIINFVQDANGEVKAIDVQFISGIHKIEPVVSKFEILSKIYVYRKQFPISLAYGKTIHKSQGLSLSTCLIDIGNSTFTHGQSYVALSRVKSLNGLHIINFDPKSVTAHSKSVQEYNRLRKTYRPDLNILKITKSIKQKTNDHVWYSRKTRLSTEMSIIDDNPNNISFIEKMPPGYLNSDGVSCYANSVCQCIFSFEEIIFSIGQASSVCQTLKMLTEKHVEGNDRMDSVCLRQELGLPFISNQQQDAEEFLTALINQNKILKDLTTNINLITKKCRNPTCGYTSVQRDKICFIRLYSDQNCKSVSIKKLVTDLSRWETSDNQIRCENCDDFCSIKTEIEVPAQIVICQIMIWDETRNKKIFNITSVSNTILEFNNQNYRIQSAIFHEGTDVESGHYKSVIRKENSWIMANDTEVYKIQKWPRNSKVGNEDFEERHEDIVSAGPSSQTEEEMGIGSLNQDFKEVFLNGNISDVVLKVKDQESSDHKCILATRSPTFMTVILHDTKEEVTPVVNLQDVDRDTFPDFINYLLTGRVENLTSESSLKLYTIAHKYQITKLKKPCLQHMMTNVSIDNFCDAYILSLRHDEVDLEKTCIQFFAQNSFDIILTAKWQSFLCENPVIGNELFIKHMQLNK